MLCAKTKVKHIIDVKNRWQKTSGLRKVANMFQSFFTFSLLALFSLPSPPCCLSISSCSSPPQIVLFLILLYFLNLNSSKSLLILLNLEYTSQLQIVSKQLAMFKLNQVPKYHNRGAHVQHFLPFSTNFQIIMLMLRLEVGEGER